MMETEIKIISSNLTWKEKKDWCEAWKKTNLSRSAFIRQHKLPKSFHYWCNQLWPKEKTQVIEQSLNNSNWVQIVSKSIPEGVIKVGSSAIDCIELKLMFGHINFNLSLPIKHMVILLRELSNAATTIR